MILNRLYLTERYCQEKNLVEQAVGASYTQVVYSVDGTKLALMNAAEL